MEVVTTVTVSFPSARAKAGSALLLTLLVVALLMVIVTAMGVMVRLELRSVTNQQNLRKARANASLGVELAVAGLQRIAGADKRVTGTADLAGYTAQPHWTGVWQSDTGDATWPGTSGQPLWLVTGPGTLTPDTPLNASNSVQLVPADPDVSGSRNVTAPLETLTGPGSLGQFAWWVGDEGVKARVDISSGDAVPASTRERTLRAQSARKPDMISLGGAWQVNPAAAIFARDASSLRGRLVSRDTVTLSKGNIPLDTIHHDITVCGYGLPVNVKDGGFKTDWSVILDQSMVGNTALQKHYMGGSTFKGGFLPPDYKADVWSFYESNMSDRSRFFLSERISTAPSTPYKTPGPNLGILWHYGRLWRQVSQNMSPLVGLTPRVDADLRLETWLPYQGEYGDTNIRDWQHVNSGVVPLVSHLRLGIRLRTQEVNTPTNGVQYAVQMEMKPLIGLWNPYSVGIRKDDYALEWFVSPMVKIRVNLPGGGSEEHVTWMRWLWSGVKDSQRWMQLWARETDFQPGEVRLFSVAQEVDQTGRNTIEESNLSPSWNINGYILVDFRTGAQGQNRLLVPPGSTIDVLNVYLQDTHHPDTQNTFTLSGNKSMAWMALKARANDNTYGLFLSRNNGFWNGGVANQVPAPGDFVLPREFDATGVMPAGLPVEGLTTDSRHMATWAFHLRTTEDVQVANQRARGLIDMDPRAPVAVASWDGSRSFASTPPDGWYMTSTYIGEGDQNRGLVATGDIGLEEPEAMPGPRYNGFLGTSSSSLNDGQTHVPVFDVPTSPLVSVGQFQHAQLGRYAYEPAFVAGNSYANVRIPLDKTVSVDHNGISGLDLYDISYDVNERIWDEIYFSTLAPDYVGGGSNWDTAFTGHLDSLPNPRMVYVPSPGDTSLNTLLATTDGDGNPRGPEALSTRVRIEGAFNVNSTSKTAWKAVLSSMVNSELPVVNPATGALSWETPLGIRFNRFSHVIEKDPYQAGDSNDTPFWRGWRKLSEQELDDLADAIVEEVKARGPFLNLGEFVNRDPTAGTVAKRRKGALQAALDRTVNRIGTSGVHGSVGDQAQPPSGSRYDAQAYNGETTAAGYASYLMQGDVLQSLAPILQARSDTFTIRAYGNTGDSSSRAWCEAVVQRTADYVKDSDPAWLNPVADVLSPLNLAFGREFEIVSFRWLEESEVEGIN